MSTGRSDGLFRLGQVMDIVHVLLQSLWMRALYFSGALWWAKRDLRRRGAIVVLTFHRILDEQAFSRTDSLPFIVVRKKTFRQLVEHVSARYDTVDVRDASPGRFKQRSAAKRLRVAFTLDDGWQDNYVNAHPILREHGIPATVFLCTGLTGQRMPFWPERARMALRHILSERCGKRSETLIEALIESLKYCSSEARDAHIHMLRGPEHSFGTGGSYEGDVTLTWDQVRIMHRHGVRFGSHSHSHPILTTVPLEAMADEIRMSKRAFEAKLGTECDVFAYPNGDWSPEIREAVAACGFRCAFTTERGAWLASSDPLAIPRANVQQQDLVGPSGRFSPVMFEYATFWKAWLATRRKEKRSEGPARASVAALPRETA